MPPKPVTVPATMTRLAFIRLLYLQGVTQADLAEPLNFTSVLTFHDAAELFLVLAVDHLGAPLPRRDPSFLDYWQILQPSATFPAGVNLTGQPGMDRLNRHRNALKHTGTWPGPAAMQDARASIASFLEDNAPRIFAIDFDAIDLADLVPQLAARAKLKEAAAAEVAGNRTDAMALLAKAFRELLATQPPRARELTKLRPVPFSSGAASKLANAVTGQGPARNNRMAAQSHAQAVDGQITNIIEAVGALQEAASIMALGIDYSRYTRFQILTPRIARNLSGETKVHPEPGYAPSRQEYDECAEFVITVAMRMAELERLSVAPSWRTP